MNQIEASHNANHDVATIAKSQVGPTSTQPTTSTATTATAASKKYHYRDYANVQESDEDSMFEPQNPAYPRPAADPHSMRLQKFPAKLDSILSRPEWQDIITWMPHGRSWKILKPHDFETLVMPLYFDHCNYHSFNRLVNAWSFRRMSSGPDRGSYYHDLFLRGRPNLHKHMRRLPKSHKKQPMSKEDEPDFYSMEKLDPLPNPEPSLALAARGGAGGPAGYAAAMAAKTARAGANPHLAPFSPGSFLGAAAAGAGAPGDDVASALLNIRVQQQLERQYLAGAAAAGSPFAPPPPSQNLLGAVGAPGPAAAASFLGAQSALAPYPGAGLGAAGLPGGMGAASLSGEYYNMLLAKRARDSSLLNTLGPLGGQAPRGDYDGQAEKARAG